MDDKKIGGGHGSSVRGFGFHQRVSSREQQVALLTTRAFRLAVNTGKIDCTSVYTRHLAPGFWTNNFVA